MVPRAARDRRPLPAPRRRRLAYVEFRVGDHQHELGIVSRGFAPDGWDTGTGGAVLYWHVDDIEAARPPAGYGATPYEPITQRGPGFTTAAMTDPFGNVLGGMYNQHYLDMLSQGEPSSTERSLA